jgi:glycosyltransferase involved in cell wall biosynthesis
MSKRHTRGALAIQPRDDAHPAEPTQPTASPAPVRKKKLAYFINCFPNFIEAMIYREVMALRARGYDLTTFSIRRPNATDVPDEARALATATIYILPIPIWAFLRTHARAFARAPWTYVRTLLEVVGGTHERLRDRWRSLCHFAEAVVIVPEVERLGIEHLHAHWAVGAATCAMVVSRFLDIPFTFTAHAYDIWLDRLLLPEKLRAADGIVTCTDYNRRHLIDLYGTPTEKVRVVYHGLDLQRFQRRSRPRNTRPVILSVGRLVEQKGYEDLVRVCADLVRAGYDFTCEIIGEGPLRPRLERLIDELGLGGVVRLPGRVVGDVVLDCYARADVFALFCVEASDGDRDGIPNTMIEAMGMELPVVSTRYSGVPELVVEGETGFLADCGDRRTMVEQIGLLLTQPELRARMGSAGRARVMEDFATDAALGKLERIFASDFRRGAVRG